MSSPVRKSLRFPPQVPFDATRFPFRSDGNHRWQQLLIMIASFIHPFRILMQFVCFCCSIAKMPPYFQIGCCGAEGSSDYITLRQPLPSACRNTITGNAFYNGCVDELTWLLEDKSAWVASLAMSLAIIQVSAAPRRAAIRRRSEWFAGLGAQKGERIKKLFHRPIARHL